MIMTMNASAYSEAQFNEAMEHALDDLVPALLPNFVRNLNRWTKCRARHLHTATTAAEASGSPPADACPLYLFAHALGIPWTLARALRLARSA